MKKLLACDVDGTLLQTGESATPEDCAAIREFRKQGHYFALCTGRTVNWVAPLFETAPLETDGMILANGASLYRVDSCQPFRFHKLFTNAIPAEIGREIISYLYLHENVMIYWGDGESTYQLADRRLETLKTFASASEGTVFLTYEEYLSRPMDIIGFGTAPISQSTEDAQRIRGVIEKQWGKYIHAVINVFFVDVMVKSVSKGDGIRHMLEILKSPHKAFGIGDSFNDEPMFRFVGRDHAFLMEDGDSDLRPLAHKRVKSVAECIDILLTDKSYD